MLSAYKGEFDNAIKYWYKAAENATISPSRGDYEFKKIIGTNGLNIICFLNFLEEENLADKIRSWFSKEITFYIEEEIILLEELNKDDNTDISKDFLLKNIAQIQMLAKDNNDEIFNLIKFKSDDYETFFDPTFDEYSAALIYPISITYELTNGKYSTIFEKDESERKEQLLTIKANL